MIFLAFLHNAIRATKVNSRKNGRMFSFVSSKFVWLCLVAGSRYLQCDGLGDVGVLDEVG